jgi:glucose/mannose-6-phosphate isomerase
LTSSLDDPAARASTDPAGMLGVVERTAEQWAEAVRRALDAEGLPDAGGISSVAVCGMGGSGIAGDVLQAIAAPRARVPVAVVKGYGLPAWVGPDTLCILLSYSGNTEETLACFEQAETRKARLVVVSTGGAISARAADRGVTVMTPVAGLQPRAAFASLVAPVLIVAQRLGIVDDVADEVAETEHVLRDRARALAGDVPTADNEAKRLAERLDGALPLIWGQDGILAAAAARWRTQLNENAKVPAISSVLPELDHNEIAGWDPGVAAMKDIVLVTLRDTDEHPRIAARIGSTLLAMSHRVGGVAEAYATGVSPLARLMSTVLLGDFTSVYLALRRGVDPTPVEALDRVKNELR